MLADNPNLKNLKSPKRKPKGQIQKGVYYSDQQKVELAKLWLVTGNLTQSAIALDIPYKTAAQWKASDWWANLISELRSETKLQLSAKLRAIADKSLGVTIDRLDNGDFVYDQKSGQLVRKPVSMKDAHRVAVDLIDRYTKIEAQPFEEANDKVVLDRLEQLKQTFERFAGKKVEVTDVYFAKEIKNDADVQEVLGGKTLDDVSDQDTTPE